MLIPPALMFHNISSSEDSWTTEPQQWTGVPSKAINYDRKLELNKIYLLHRHPVQQEQPACNTSKHKSSCSKGHTLATLILLELNAGTELSPLMEHTHNATASISSVMRVNLLFDLCHWVRIMFEESKNRLTTKDYSCFFGLLLSNSLYCDWFWFLIFICWVLPTPLWFNCSKAESQYVELLSQQTAKHKDTWICLNGFAFICVLSFWCINDVKGNTVRHFYWIKWNFKQGLKWRQENSTS